MEGKEKTKRKKIGTRALTQLVMSNKTKEKFFQNLDSIKEKIESKMHHKQENEQSPSIIVTDSHEINEKKRSESREEEREDQETVENNRAQLREKLTNSGGRNKRSMSYPYSPNLVRTPSLIFCSNSISSIDEESLADIFNEMKRSRAEQRLQLEEKHETIQRRIFRPEESLLDQLGQLEDYINDSNAMEDSSPSTPSSPLSLSSESNSLGSPKDDKAKKEREELRKQFERFLDSTSHKEAPEKPTSFSKHPFRKEAFETMERTIEHSQKLSRRKTQFFSDFVQSKVEAEKDLNTMNEEELKEVLEKERRRSAEMKLQMRRENRVLRKLEKQSELLFSEYQKFKMMGELEREDFKDQMKDLEIRGAQEKTSQNMMVRHSENLEKQVDFLRFEVEIKKRELEECVRDGMNKIKQSKLTSAIDLTIWEDQLENTIKTNESLNKEHAELASTLEQVKDSKRTIQLQLDEEFKKQNDMEETVATTWENQRKLKEKAKSEQTLTSASTTEELDALQPIPENQTANKNHLTLQLVRKCTPIHSGSVRSILCVGNTIWAACGDGTITLWDVITGLKLVDFQAHEDSIFDMRLIEDSCIWTTSKDNHIHVWSKKRSEGKAPSLIKKIKVSAQTYCSIMLQVEDKVWGGHMNGSVTVWSADKFKVLKEFHEGNTIGSMIRRGDCVWIGTEDNIVLCDAKSARPKNFLSGHKSTITSMVLVGPREVWSTSLDETMRCWNAETEECTHVISLTTKIFALIELRSVGFVLAGCRNESILVFDSNSYSFVKELKGAHNDATVGFALDKQGRIWTASWDGSICIWKKGFKSEENT